MIQFIYSDGTSLDEIPDADIGLFDIDLGQNTRSGHDFIAHSRQFNLIKRFYIHSVLPSPYYCYADRTKDKPVGKYEFLCMIYDFLKRKKEGGFVELYKKY